MAASVNKVIILGNVGRDPEVRHLENGVVVANFTVATTEKFKDRDGASRDKTEWHNIVCWRQLAEVVEKFVRKGTQVYIEGKLRQRDYTDQSGAKRYVVEIYADSLQLLGKRSDGVAPQAAPQQAPYAQQESRPTPPPMQQSAGSTDFPDEGFGADSADDLPF